MASRKMHLDKGPSGMAARTACGRSLLRTPMSTNWPGFLGERAENRCTKCAASGTADLMNRRSLKATT